MGQVGPVSFKVELAESQVICSRHQDHIRVKYDANASPLEHQEFSSGHEQSPVCPELVTPDTVAPPDPPNLGDPRVSQEDDSVESSEDKEVIVGKIDTQTTPKTYGRRNRKPPDWFMWD